MCHPTSPRPRRIAVIHWFFLTLMAWPIGVSSLAQQPSGQKPTVPEQAPVQERLQQLEVRENQLSPEAASKQYHELLLECESQKDALGMGRVKLGLARVAMRQRNPDEALRLASEALPLLASDVRFGAMAYFELANIHMARGDPETALVNYQKALPGFREAKDSFQEGRTLNGIGNVYFYTGLRERAWENYLGAYRIAQSTGNAVLLGRSLNNLGYLATWTGRYAEAIDFYQQSLDLKLKANDEIGAARTYNGFGVVYVRLGNYVKALEYYEAALKIFQARAPQEASIALNNIGGTVFKNLEQYDAALDYLQKAYNIASASRNLLEMLLPLNNQGYVYSIQGRYEESLKKHQEALKVAREIPAPEYELHALHGMANNLFRMEKYPDALDAFQQVVSLSERLKSPDTSVGGHTGMGRTYEKLGQPAMAQAKYRAAINTIETARGQVQSDTEKAEYLENNLEAYTNLVRVLADSRLVSASALAEAFSIAEKGRARVLLELLADSRNRIAPKVEPQLAAEQETLTAKIATIQNQIRESMTGAKLPGEKLTALWQESDRLYDSYQLVQQKIRRQDPRYAGLQDPAPIGLREAERALPDDAVLLEYVFDYRRNPLGLPRESWGLCFVISRQGSRVFKVESASEIPELVSRVRNLLVRPMESDEDSKDVSAAFVSASSRLYQLLMAPAQSMLSGKKRVIVVPDRALALLPFEVLLTTSRARTYQSWSDLPYLLKNYVISYAPSASTYAEMLKLPERPQTAPKDLLVLADPVYESESPSVTVLDLMKARSTRGSFERLPYTAQEAAAVGKLFGPDRRDILQRQDATEDRFRQSVASNTYKYLLFSVHGITSVRYPQFSSLVLTRAAGSPQDGLLQAHEIYNLRLNSEVAVLSACETALGRNIQGEGLVGLTRAFFYAGARSVVASLWQVADASTAEFMGKFFGELQQGRGGAAGLRRAKLQMLQSQPYSHPFFWAPFILSGNP